ncbi:MAG: tetratricopeptide repeat protein, partial [Gemmataceae bacterium]|nr:tetratricopeptide repeat protein [Gemmataceae bacterium]
MTLEDIFLAAAEKLTATERAAFLDSACGDNAALRAQVEALLRAHDAASNLLEQPLFRPAPTETLAPPPADLGTAIGPYTLTQQLGEGGMGTVFLAEQTQPVQRQVALKIIKAGLSSRSTLARFEAERQALALMDHPHIARVFDAGTTAAGQPYFVMELVQGVPLTRYCDEHRLTARQRLELFVSVCQAVQHAHQKGIIHRDLKPSNVLVTEYDGKPVPKVIDFGVAKLSEQKRSEPAQVTEVGSVVGTLEYMSPEQAQLDALDIDTRSDIYALGVLLYELLTGTTPLERKRLKGTSLLEVLRLIREEEPPRPSTRLHTIEDLSTTASNRGMQPKKLRGLVRGDLDWIVMKCLDKDRTRRYETTNALAEDVQRYLADEPIRARPPTVGQRLGKWARRHRTAVRAAGVLLLLGVVGLGVSLGLIWQAKEEAEGAWTQEWQQRQLAQASAREAEAKLRLAQDNRNLAFEGLDKIIMELAEQGLLSLDPAQDQNARRFQLALSLYDRIAEKNRDDPAGWQQAARAYQRVGFLHRSLEQTDKAEQALARAIQFGEKAVALSPGDAGGRLLLVASLGEYAELLRDTDRPHQAEQAFRRSLSLTRQLVQERPTERAARTDLVASLVDLGFHLQANGKGQEAQPYLLEGHELLKRLVREFPRDPHLHGALGAVLHNLASPHYHREELKQARHLSEQAVHHLETARSLEHKNARRAGHLCLAYLALARTLAGLGQHDEAIKCCLKQLQLAREMIRHYPRLPAIRKALADGQEELARQLVFTGGREPAALGLLKQAQELQEQLARDHKDNPSYQEALGVSHGNLGRLLESQGKYPQAEEAYRRALGLLKDLPDAGPNRAHARLNLGNLFLKLGKLPEAEAEYRRASNEWQKLMEQSPKTAEYRQWFANARHNLGNVLKETNRLPQAEAEYRQAVAVLRDLAERHTEVLDYQFYLARSELDLARTLRARNRAEEGDPLNDRALERLERLVKAAPSRADYQTDLARCLVVRGVTLRQGGQLAEAEQTNRRAVGLWQALSSKEPNAPEHRRELAGTLYNLGILLAEARRPQDAEKTYRQARGVQHKLLQEFPTVPGYHTFYAKILNNLALRLRNRGEYDQARDLLNEAIQHDREAMKLAPENRAFRAELCNRLANLVWTQLHL